MKGPRYVTVVLLTFAAAALLYLRGNADVIPASVPLYRFPSAIEGWDAKDMVIDQETRDVLGAGDYLSRVYTRKTPGAPIGLFIAYFPTQRTGTTIHSPRNCLPGAGWYFESSKYVDLTDFAGKTHRVGEYVITNGDVRDFVTYWYQAHGRTVANEYMAKFYLVADALRMNRTDGSLVRVMSPIDQTEGIAAAKSRVEMFSKELMPILPSFIPN